MQIGPSDRIARIEARLARIEEILRALGVAFGIHGIDRELDRPEPPAPSTAVVEHQPTKRR